MTSQFHRRKVQINETYLAAKRIEYYLGGHMFRFFKELYLTLFTVGFRFRQPKQLGGGWGPFIDSIKALLIVSIGANPD